MPRSPKHHRVWLALKRDLTSEEYGRLVMHYGVTLPPKTLEGEEKIIERISEAVFYLRECPLVRKLEKTLVKLSWLTE